MRFILPALLLTGCATAPAELTAIKAKVDSQYTYAYYKGNNRPAGLADNQINCLGYAKRYFTQALLIKQQGVITACTLPDGQKHAVLDVNGWRLDNRYKWVMRVSESDCV